VQLGGLSNFLKQFGILAAQKAKLTVNFLAIPSVKFRKIW